MLDFSVSAAVTALSVSSLRVNISGATSSKGLTCRSALANGSRS